ncbi:MAG: MutS family DNA mismatch repair protein [Saprospiraceae bacterium]
MIQTEKDIHSIQELYRQRAQEFQANSERLHSKYQRFALVRLLAFFGSVALIILIWQYSGLAGIVAIVVFLLAFYRFMTWHQAIKREQEHQAELALINQNELATLDHDFTMFADGAAYQDPLHPNSIDLDLFGPYSFYQYTNRTSTALGANYLASMLTTNVDSTTIQKRQASIKELSADLEWRQHFLAYGRKAEDTLEQVNLLKKWIKQAPFIIPNRLLRALLILMPILTTAVFAWFLYQQQFFFGVLSLLPALALLRKHVLKVNSVHEQTTHAEKALRHYALLIKHIETKGFETEHLQDLHRVFEGQVSKRLQKLSYIISQLNARYNAFAIILNIFGLWDLQWVYRLEKWKQAQKDLLPLWFDALADFEALSSLATTAYNNPDWIFPEIGTTDEVSAKQLGHPLLHRNKRVANDVHLPTKGHIKLLTGSNMAGKSTFLRTVGLNIVLGMSGAPVCAQEMHLPLLKVYTSMRTQDALHESTSSFYAELKRLKLIIEAVEADHQVFFLLDEILKGTNSRDRHTGSKALIKQLIQQGGAGIIATHDLELGSLEAQYNGTIENWCMEVAIEKDQLFFDYQLKKGVSKSFNATVLMKNMGIKIEDAAIDATN